MKRIEKCTFFGNNRMGQANFVSYDVLERFAKYAIGLTWTNVTDFFLRTREFVTKILFFPFDLVKAYKQFNNSINYDNIWIGNKVSTLGAFQPNDIPYVTYLDFGTYFIERTYNDFRDYEPYSKYSIYLPFLGVKELKSEQIVGKYLSIVYIVNYLTGDCLVDIKTSLTNDENDWYTIKNYTLRLGVELPIGGTNAGQESIKAVLNVLKTVFVTSYFGSMTGGLPALVTGIGFAAKGAMETGINLSSNINGIFSEIGNGSENVYLGKECYIIKQTNEIDIPTNYGKTYGFPAHYTAKLSTLNGFTIVDNPHLEGTDFNLCLDDEKKELEKILTSGFLLDDKA